MTQIRAIETYDSVDKLTSHDIPIPTNSTGDLLLIFYPTQATTPPSSPPTGWTELGKIGQDSNTAPVWIFVYGKVSAGTEGATVTIASGESGGTITRTAVISVSVQDWLGTLPDGVSLAGLKPSLDPPSVSVDDPAALWLTFIGAQSSDYTFVQPSSYTLEGQVANSDTSLTTRLRVALASRAVSASSENPNAWTYTGVGTPNNSGVWTVGIQSAAVNASITITDIKEANEADTLVTDVTNAEVKVWYGTEDSGLEDESHAAQSITGGEMTVALDAGTVGGSFVATWTREVSTGVFRYGRATGTITEAT